MEGTTPTLYSNIYDLKRLKVHLFYFHNFQREVVLDVTATDIAQALSVSKQAILQSLTKAGEVWEDLSWLSELAEQ